MNSSMMITLLLCLVMNTFIIDAYNLHHYQHQHQQQYYGYKHKHYVENTLYSKASYNNRLSLQRLFMSETEVQSNSPSNPPANAEVRVYKPRSDPTRVGSGITVSDTNNRSYTPPNRDGNSANAGRSYTPPGRSYTPPGRESTGGGGGQNKNWSDGPSVFLKYPQLLIKYKVPKEMSESKQLMLTQQKQFAEAFEASQASWGSRGGNSYGGGGGRGGYGGGKDTFFDAFDSAPLSFSDGKRGAKGKKTEEIKGKKPTEEGRLKKVKGSDNKGGEEDDVDYEDEIEGDEVIEDDYYGDVVTDVTIADVPADTLRNMETEGYSLEEMQMAIYGEFGIKVSINAVKRRLFDDKNERKGKKRTGKTRRDRSKARNARFNPVVDKGITLPEGNVIQVAELARLMDLGAGEVVKHLMMNAGVMATMNMNIDMTLAKQVIEAFGKKLAGDGTDDEDDDDDDDDEEELDLIDLNSINVERLPRPPVVTIMGHVDHGKTSLLDYIRKSQVAAGEAGGITQAISAFKVRTANDQDVTFIDTPGHAAFRDMRKRGANITDIVVLVVAADDGIMEQTKESIAAAKAANCPIVIAINKIDKEGADPQAVMTALMSYDLLVEDFGGEIQCAKVSAKKGDGIESLLEKVLLQAEVMALKAPYDTKAGGSVIEARVDKGLGPIVTALVQKGTLRVGDFVLAGPSWGRVRRIISDQGQNLKEAGPSTPVQIVGMNSVPNAGDQIVVTDNEEEAREVAEARQRLARQASGSQSISSIIAQAAGMAAGTADNKEQIKVPILIKGDVSGSVEAIQSSILDLQLSDDEATCKPDIVFAGVGPVTSSDVAIAAVSKAKIIAFNVAADMNAMDEARASNVEIGYYNVVYDLLDEIEAKIKKTLSPPPPGTLVGRAEIKKVFKIGKVGKIAGCSVIEGIIKMESQVRIMRGKRNPVFTGKLSTLKVVKDDVQEVPNGSECGLGFEDFQDLEEGDIVECFIGGQKE